MTNQKVVSGANATPTKKDSTGTKIIPENSVFSWVVFRISVDLGPKCSTISLLGSALERLTEVFYERESGVE